MRVLLVDDDRWMRATLEDLLARDGHAIVAVADGAAALDAAAVAPFDVVVLDWVMPRMDGLETCRRLRATSTVPVLMLTARWAEADKVEALHAGADDYITKPFGSREFLARVHALARRAQMAPPSDDRRVIVGDVVLDPATGRVEVGGRVSQLTPTELRLLQTLASAPGLPQRTRDLVRRMGLGPGEDGAALIKTNVLRIRRKIEPDPARPRYLVTFHGVGYALRSGTPVE
jgi:DNA-binding response OmpR family regulator